MIMVHFYARALFVLGVSIGFFIGIAIRINYTERRIEKTTGRPFSHVQYNDWALKTAKFKRSLALFDDIRYGNETFHPESQYLYDRVNVLCVILVRNERNVKAAKDTWIRGCNDVKLILIESTSVKSKIPVKRKREDSPWVLLCNFLCNQVPEESNWIVIVNDYTFILLENLRMFVARLNPNDRYYLGHAISFWSTVYNDGGAGYVLSKGSLKALQNKFKGETTCMSGLTYWNREDYYLGKHLKSLNITPSDTRDDDGLSTFHPYNLYHTLFPEEDYHKMSVFPGKCCSKFTVAFQAIEGDKMYTYYYLLYTVQLFLGGDKGNKPPPTSRDDEEPWKVFLQSRNVTTNISSEQYYKIWENILDDPTSFARHIRREESRAYDLL